MKLEFAALCLFAAASATVGAQPIEDRGWDAILTDVPQEERVQLSGQATFDVPEVYELAMVIVSLTKAGPDMVVDSEYAERVKAHFSSFSDHEAVQALNLQSRAADWYSAYEFRENASVYCFDAEQPSLIVRCKPYSHAWGRQANLFARNLSLVADFAEQSGFRAFYQANKEFYQSEVQAWKDRVDMRAMKRWLEARFPVSEDYYSVVFSPLTDGWHSTQGFKDDDFAIRVMYLQSVSGEPDENAFNAARIVFTEIDHSHVDTVALDYSERLNASSSFGGEFWFKTEDGTYDNGFRVFAEYMTWAVFELWARETYPADQHERIARQVAEKMTTQRRFIHYAAFRDALVKLYSEQVGKPDIAALYPAILSWAENYRAETDSDFAN